MKLIEYLNEKEKKQMTTSERLAKAGGMGPIGRWWNRPAWELEDKLNKKYSTPTPTSNPDNPEPTSTVELPETPMIIDRKQLKIDLVNWYNKILKQYEVPQNKLLKSSYRKYFFDMIRASKNTAKYYKIPSVEVLIKQIPPELLNKLKEEFKINTIKQHELKKIFKALDLDLNFLGGNKYLPYKGNWNFYIFKNAITNKEMADVQIKYNKNLYNYF